MNVRPGPIGVDPQVFDAERLLKVRTCQGQQEFLVKWKGWDNKHNTWEPRGNILDESLIQEFEKHGSASATSAGIKQKCRSTAVVLLSNNGEGKKMSGASSPKLGKTLDTKGDHSIVSGGDGKVDNSSAEIGVGLQCSTRDGDKGYVSCESKSGMTSDRKAVGAEMVKKVVQRKHQENEEIDSNKKGETEEAAKEAAADVEKKAEQQPRVDEAVNYGRSANRNDGNPMELVCDNKSVQEGSEEFKEGTGGLAAAAQKLIIHPPAMIPVLHRGVFHPYLVHRNNTSNAFLAAQSQSSACKALSSEDFRLIDLHANFQEIAERRRLAFWFEVNVERCFFALAMVDDSQNPIVVGNMLMCKEEGNAIVVEKFVGINSTDQTVRMVKEGKPQIMEMLDKLCGEYLKA